MIKPFKLFLIGLLIISITSFFMSIEVIYVINVLKKPIIELGKEAKQELLKKDTVYQIIIHQQDTLKNEK